MLILSLSVQDDTADWEKESAVMADIYSGSYINIAASNASHCGAGFLGPRKMPMTERIEIHDSEGDLEVYLVAQQTRNYVGSIPRDAVVSLLTKPRHYQAIPSKHEPGSSKNNSYHPAPSILAAPTCSGAVPTASRTKNEEKAGPTSTPWTPWYPA